MNLQAGANFWKEHPADEWTDAVVASMKAARASTVKTLVRMFPVCGSLIESSTENTSSLTSTSVVCAA